MALYYNIIGIGFGEECELHIGNKEGIRRMNADGGLCVSLQADGDELEAIRRQFANIPMHNTRRVVRWNGPAAAFIAMNFQ